MARPPRAVLIRVQVCSTTYRAEAKTICDQWDAFGSWFSSEHWLLLRQPLVLIRLNPIIRSRSFPTFRDNRLIQLLLRGLATANAVTFSKSNSRTARCIAISMYRLQSIATYCRRSRGHGSTILILRESIAPCTV